MFFIIFFTCEAETCKFANRLLVSLCIRLSILLEITRREYHFVTRFDMDRLNLDPYVDGFS